MNKYKSYKIEEYNGEITINKTTVIKAIAYKKIEKQYKVQNP